MVSQRYQQNFMEAELQTGASPRKILTKIPHHVKLQTLKVKITTKIPSVGYLHFACLLYFYTIQKLFWKQANCGRLSGVGGRKINHDDHERGRAHKARF